MIALITARGGSKGLPDKNIRTFLGEPLIAHTIVAAQRSRSIDRVIVSTDSEAIAMVARNHGAEIPFIRPPELATDNATSRDVILHALNYLETESKETVESICLLQPTSPLRNAGDIDAAVRIFNERAADSVMSTVVYEHPVQWAMLLGDANRILQDKPSEIARRQDMKIYYRPNGAIYLFRSALFKQADSYVGDRSFAYVMPVERSYDIDTEYDFIAAEAVGRHLMDKRKHE